jgi:hypothetical protein
MADMVSSLPQLKMTARREMRCQLAFLTREVDISEVLAVSLGPFVVIVLRELARNASPGTVSIAA